MWEVPGLVPLTLEKEPSPCNVNTLSTCANPWAAGAEENPGLKRGSRRSPAPLSPRLVLICVCCVCELPKDSIKDILVDLSPAVPQRTSWRSVPGLLFILSSPHGGSSRVGWHQQRKKRKEIVSHASREKRVPLSQACCRSLSPSIWKESQELKAILYRKLEVSLGYCEPYLQRGREGTRLECH